MRERAVLLAAAIAVGALGGAHASETTDGQDFALIERGRYLATVADCAACHTVPGAPPFAGGRPIETPFGIVAAPNITPDRETGIGAWSDAAFDGALREGKRRDGKLLYPAMPYTAYTKMPRAEVLAIRAYLGTLEPVRNKVEANQLPFPLNIRTAMLAWNALYFTPGEYKPDPTKSAEWNRGAYIVQGPGHCGACHTPKSLLGGDKDGAALQGYQIQGWFAPDLTRDARRGLGRWSAADIVAYLKTGHNAQAAASGPMAEEVELSSSHMTDADLASIASYLKDGPVGDPAGPAALSASDPVMAAGAAVFRDACSSCHAADGRGVPSLFPALTGSASVQSRDATSLIRVVLQGARAAATAGEPTAPGMPAFGWQLDDTQVAAALTYIRNAWGNAADAVAPDEVRRSRGALAKRTD